RVDSVRVARRQLLTRTTAELPPPRVVLHLPDLNALDGVVLGPPKPAAQRRFDAAHTAEESRTRGSRSERDSYKSRAIDDADDGALPQPVEPTLANVLRVPLRQLAPKLLDTNNIQRIGKLLVLLQQPKMLLAAIIAAGLQLAAVLAMFTGQAPTDQSKSPNSGGDNSPVAVSGPNAGPSGGPIAGHRHPDPINGGGAIRTPASMGFGLPQLPAGGSSPPENIAVGPTAPSLPPPQSLPGANPTELPSWGGPSIAGAPTSAPPNPAEALPGSSAVTVGTAPTSTSAGKPTRAKLIGTIKTLSNDSPAPGGAK
ncbi:MAG: hypothetical protein J0M17_20950, partial [Planctomycetes bacterium]|nr:hypothetical protein [Planctomycetota bacterium]